MTCEVPQFKVTIVGNAKVGKSSFVERHSSGNFTKEYKPTKGNGITHVTYNTNYGEMILQFWDCAGDKKNQGFTDCYYIGSDGFILMFDVTDKNSYKNLTMLWKEIYKYEETPQIVLCGNKVDCKERIVESKEIVFHRRKNIQYYDISSKSNHNLFKPIEHLLRKFTGKEDLCLL